MPSVNPKSNRRPTILKVRKEVVVGEVALTDEGDRSPTEVALGLIGKYEYDNPEGGVYTFPAADGSTMRIEVDYSNRSGGLEEWLYNNSPANYERWRKEVEAGQDLA